MAVNLSPVSKMQFLSATGAPLAAGLVFTYAAGTTTPLATFTDSTGATPNANPIVLDAGGFANIWLTTNLGYKFVVQNSLGVTQWTTDNIIAFLTVSPQKQIFTGSGTFTIPPGITRAKVTVVGAGGGGGGGTAASVGGQGGGSGGTGIAWLLGLTPGNTLTVGIGLGGVGGVGGTANGVGTSGQSSAISSGTQIISTITANGGSSGGSAIASTGPGVGGAAGSGGDMNFGGNAGLPVPAASTNIGGGGAGSSLGGGGTSGQNGANGIAGSAPGAGGGGGGGSVGNTTGGAGKDGIAIFEWVA